MTHAVSEMLPCASLVPVMQAASKEGILGGHREVPAGSLSQGGQGGVLGEEKQVGLEWPQTRWPQRLGPTQVVVELPDWVSAAGWESCSLVCMVKGIGENQRDLVWIPAPPLTSWVSSCLVPSFVKWR